ncbi:MAG: VacJ family lipoprotein, partial [Sphingomonadaceae bacterium]|nr:VacJ family lipoprotein [Sphingomonadaceae bacterium]
MLGVSAAVLAVALAALPAQLAQDVAQTANPPAPSAPVSTPETANVPTLDALPTTPPSVATPDDAPEEIVVTAKRRAIAADPLENFNETSFEVIQSVDKAFVGPVAIAYREKIPGPMRKGVRNFLS